MELERKYVRRRITWKVSDVADLMRRNLREESPEITILLGNNETKWTLVAKKNVSEEEGDLSCNLQLKSAQRHDFTIFHQMSISRLQNDSERRKSHASRFTSSVQVVFIGDTLHDESGGVLDDYGGITVEAEVELIEDSKYVKPELTQVAKNYEKLINNGKLSDFCFSCCDEKNVYVQKSIVAVQCPALADLMKDCPMKAEVPDIDSETMTELVRFVYCGKVKKMDSLALKLLKAAHKFGVDDLKKICVSSLVDLITFCNVFVVLEIADQLGEEKLKGNCIDFIKCKYHRINYRWEHLKAEVLRDIWKSTIEKPTRLMFQDAEVEM